jgi:hypothetical protein
MVAMKLMTPSSEDTPARWSENREKSVATPEILDVVERGVESPARARAVAQKQTEHDEDEAHGEEPEAHIVQARKGHVRRADHPRHHPVAEAADQGRHDEPEDHDKAVRGDDGVPRIAVGDDGVVRIHELLAHDHGERAADAGADHRHGNVERADICGSCSSANGEPFR